MQPFIKELHQHRNESYMKLSKQILTMIVAGSAVATVSTSCEKENPRPNEKEQHQCVFGDCENDEKCNEPVYCEACGMG